MFWETQIIVNIPVFELLQRERVFELEYWHFPKVDEQDFPLIWASAHSLDQQSVHSEHGSEPEGTELIHKTFG